MRGGVDRAAASSDDAGGMTTSMVAGLAALVLAGGKSQRMGTPKPLLNFGGEALVARVARRAGEAAKHVVVVADAEIAIPPIDGVAVFRDPNPWGGPLLALAPAIRSLSTAFTHVFVTATDMPFLSPALIRALHRRIGGQFDAAAPSVDGRDEPLCGVYPVDVAREIDAWASVGRAAARELTGRKATRLLDRAALLTDPELRAIDPGLRSLCNINTPKDYALALEELSRVGA